MSGEDDALVKAKEIAARLSGAPLVQRSCLSRSLLLGVTLAAHSILLLRLQMRYFRCLLYSLSFMCASPNLSPPLATPPASWHAAIRLIARLGSWEEEESMGRGRIVWPRM